MIITGKQTEIVKINVTPYDILCAAIQIVEKINPKFGVGDYIDDKGHWQVLTHYDYPIGEPQYTESGLATSEEQAVDALLKKLYEYKLKVNGMKG